jgi:hypothetical protein
MTTLELPLQIKRELRKIAGTTDTKIAVEIVEGSEAPQETGESYYWTTPSGKTRISHPNAYRWRKVYHGSTRAVTVGMGWLSDKRRKIGKQCLLLLQQEVRSYRDYVLQHTESWMRQPVLGLDMYLLQAAAGGANQLRDQAEAAAAIFSNYPLAIEIKNEALATCAMLELIRVAASSTVGVMTHGISTNNGRNDHAGIPS